MFKRKILFFLLILLQFKSEAQFPDFRLQNYRPATPSAFSFLKYTEMPVSEYTGLPKISIPIYEISDGGVTIPITLSYHAAGFRISQEASWVGLGWDLNFGSIIQEINDVDDYGQVVQARPDYTGNPVPSFYPMYSNYNCAQTLNTTYINPVPVSQCQPYYAYKIYTAYYMPINGITTNQLLGRDIVTSQSYDSEPDIFTANFLGHSVKFMKEFQGNNIVVLNNKGYKINKTGDTFIITVPSGESYYFEQHTIIESYTNEVGGIGNLGTASSPLSTTSKIWMLTKIVTNNNNNIIFNYSLSSNTYDNFPTYSEKWDKSISSNVTSLNAASASFNGYQELNTDGLGKTYSYSREKRFLLNSISFSKGTVLFTSSSRSDMLGASKLDQIQVFSTTNDLIKSCQFNYSYFDATGVSGTVYVPTNLSSFGNTVNLRLKLNTVTINTDEVYNFSYDNTNLPPKNSLAQDFWGFYNGELTNTTLIPNPSRLNPDQLSGITNLGDNGTNNSSRLPFTKAGVLDEIQYPTGGKVKFEYELNTFDNYLVPDYSSTTNSVSSGNGLRIALISYLASDNIVSKKMKYTYYGGKALQPIQFSRLFNVNSYQTYGGTLSGAVNYYQIIEINAKGFYSTNSLGSGNSVGYDKVKKETIDVSGNSLGWEESLFNNVPDRLSNSANLYSQLSATLPCVKNISAFSSGTSNNPENGTLLTTEVYNTVGFLQKKTINSYYTLVSDIYYGARLFGSASYVYQTDCEHGGYWTTVPCTLAGYYPIYDIQTFLSSQTITEFDANNNTTVSTEMYNYDFYGQLSTKSTTTSKGHFVYEYFEHPIDYYTRTGDLSLLVRNRHTEVVRYKKEIRHKNYFANILASTTKEKSYVINSTNNDIIANVFTETARDAVQSNTPFPKTTNIDYFDDKSNPLQVRTPDGMTNCFIWDYDKTYVSAEIKNAPLYAVAATSFESNGKGNFTYDGTPINDPNAPTGTMVYPLINGIQKNVNDPTKNYTVSLWASANAFSVNGSTVPTRTGPTLKGYTYYEWDISGTNSIQISGAGFVKIDELRVYPKDAQVITYTYKPLVGLTSICDINNKIIYYEYDTSNRLKLIKDQDGKVAKVFDYQYQAQPSY